MAEIINKLKETIDKSVATVSVKSSTAIESSKIRGYISNLKNQKQGLIEQMGNNIYSLYINNKLEIGTVEQMCFEIKHIDNAINEQLEELKKIQEEEKKLLGSNEESNTITCTCGQVVNRSSKFCTNCGKPVGIVDYICTCGTKLEINSKFCYKCGKKVEKA